MNGYRIASSWKKKVRHFADLRGKINIIQCVFQMNSHCVILRRDSVRSASQASESRKLESRVTADHPGGTTRTDPAGHHEQEPTAQIMIWVSEYLRIVLQDDREYPVSLRILLKFHRLEDRLLLLLLQKYWRNFAGTGYRKSRKIAGSQRVL